MLEQSHDAAGLGERVMGGAGGTTEPGTTALYTRSMPGGGYVRVELLVADPSGRIIPRAPIPPC